MMRSLFDTTRMGTMELRNRLVRSATWEGMADENGHVTPRLLEVYRELAEGGIGLVITSATIIEKDGVRIPGMLSIADEAAIPGFRELAETVHTAGSPVVMQLTTIGTCGEHLTPESLTRDELRLVIRDFGDAACRAEQAGIDGVQVHSGHGFFISQFLNQHKNTRADEYGGPVENRIRFLTEICDEIRARTRPSFNLLVKINCSDLNEPHGNDSVWEACQAACRALAERGLTGIEITGGASGALHPPKEVPYVESIFRDYAAGIARMVDIPVILVGLNRSPQVLRGILAVTRIGYFSLARPLLRQPDLPLIWEKNPNEPSACTSCDSCRGQEGGNFCPFRE
jgi:2,4-dienoyl-CoA reductase-like NADH-dependent reductase (Old Yellow Enzyme family)